jgi:NADH dehydrogenase/NADH:ubiquinone oxidoreductase subunit G
MEFLAGNNKLKHATRDLLVSMVSVGADPDFDNLGQGMTDRAFVVEARRKGGRYGWDEASFWNAVHAAERYLITWDNQKKAKADQQAKYDAELAASRKAFSDALTNKTDTATVASAGGVVQAKSTAKIQPKGKPAARLGFSPAVAVGIIAAALAAATLLTRKSDNA